MNAAADGPDTAMLVAMAELWRLRPPGPDNIFAHPAFVRLREACRHGYPAAGQTDTAFALWTALRALGLPCHLRADTAHLAQSAEEAALGLDAALRATHSRRLHIAPLDMADDLPPLAFGPAKLCRLTAAEVRGLFDDRRLRRVHPQAILDADRLSEFHWLIVEETVVFEHGPEARAVPSFSMDLSRDLGLIEPHKGRFPRAFEDALFFLLLAPWESWSTMQEVEWRGFRVPWVYTVDSDIFVRPRSPPSPDTLTWDEHFHDDGRGGTYEEVRPLGLQLDDDAASELIVWDESRWATVARARQSPLFETPIVHFLIRAFLAEGVDEFLAHITTIEAALGLRADYRNEFRIAPDRHKGMSATKRMRARVAGLLGCREFAAQYERVFDIRSAFLHGRSMPSISTTERVMARSLARRVVEALILATEAVPVSSREDFLDGLIDNCPF